MDNDDFFLLALRELPGVGERTLARLMAAPEPLHAVLDSSPTHLAAVHGLPPRAVARLAGQRRLHMARCRHLWEELRSAETRFLRHTSAAYPTALARSLNPPPPLLFAIGDPSIAAPPCVAILGSREVEDQTLPAIVAVLRQAHAERLSVAIGGMKTTHRLAAIAARALGNRRVVVLDRGLLAAFRWDFSTDPFGSGAGGRRARFDRASTLVVSPFRPEDHAAPNSGRRRDEIIAALGTMLFASSVREGGEVERICHEALAIGKPVFVWKRLNRSLARAGARCIEPRTLAAGLRRLLGQSPARGGAPPEAPPRSPRSDRTPKSREA